MESSIRTDLRFVMSYGDYLDLDRLLSAQHPRSSPEHHDELLFIVQHQTSELWLRLVLHELRAARQFVAAGELAPAVEWLGRGEKGPRALVRQGAVLGT